MKTIIKKAVYVTVVGLFFLVQGCATQPQQKTDTDKVKHNAEDSFKELQHEEHH